MVEQEKVVYLESGKWMQYELFVEEMSNKTSMTENDIRKKIHELIDNKQIIMTHMTGYKYINYDSVVPKYIN